jgi:LacI family transcriptional regulator
MVLLANSLNHLDWELGILEMFRSRGMDGVLIAPGNERNARLLAAISNLGIPAVVVDRDMAARQDRVLFDHASGVEQAIGHLLDLGHRDIALVIAGTGRRPMRRRLEGYRAAFAARGLVPDEALIVGLATSTSEAFGAIDALLATARPPTAIATLGTTVLGDVLNAISARGLQVPQDLSVVSMGDPDFARAHVPPIATVTVDLELAASECSRLLLQRMRGEFGGAPRRVLVPTLFAAKGACAAPRRSRR